MRVQVFDREQISVDILAEMGHEDLKQIGITAFGHRHKLLKGIEKLLSGNGRQKKGLVDPESLRLDPDLSFV